MSTAVPKDFPRCGACVYWTGEKRVDVNLVHYDAYSTGRCSNFQSPAGGQTVSADHYCHSKKDY